MKNLHLFIPEFFGFDETFISLGPRLHWSYKSKMSMRSVGALLEEEEDCCFYVHADREYLVQLK